MKGGDFGVCGNSEVKGADFGVKRGGFGCLGGILR